MSMEVLSLLTFLVMPSDIFIAVITGRLSSTRPRACCALVPRVVRKFMLMIVKVLLLVPSIVSGRSVCLFTMIGDRKLFRQIRMGARP